MTSTSHRQRRALTPSLPLPRPYGLSAHVAVARLMFGFSLDEQKFIEIAMDTDTKFRVELEMPGRLWSVYQKEITIEGLPKLHDIVEHFFVMPLDDFKKFSETIR